MRIRALPLLAAGGFLWLQAQAQDVTFDRILHAAQEPQNWLTYSGTEGSQRYSALAQITPANARNLELKWVFQAHTLDKEEVTPLVVDGVMYTIQSPNDVVALDAATGAKLWTYTHKPDPAARNCCGHFTRGLAILGDTLFLAAFDSRMIAINAKTGKEIWNVPVEDPKEGYAFTHAPIIVKDKVIAGTAGGDFGVRGFIAAWDAKTGKEVWRFHTIPGPGEPGHETWGGDSWKHGGGAVWATGSYDPELNLTYWGIGNPGPDWNGDGRPGDNLYSCSVVALDADTGKLKWYYQFSPHNEFDWDSTQVPVLADIEWKGKPRKVMLWANRNGMFYALDRTTGEFLLGKPFVKVNWATGFDEKGRPMRAPGIEPSKAGTLVYPANQGGTNWFSPSFSPRTGLFYVSAVENSSSVYAKEDTPPDFVEGKAFAGDFPRKTTAHDDVYGAVRAIDPQTGAMKWQYREASNSTEAGVLTTASDLLFSGSRDGSFFALDARTGAELWKVNLGASVASGPMTYSVNGKQYVSVAVGNSLFTFGLR